MSDRNLRIPDHELLQPIARGGYGEVWLARNVLGTFRAVKIVFRAAFRSDRPFAREFEGLCRGEEISRSHEGLVDILQVGWSADRSFFYYVMELADDSSGQAEIAPEGYRPKTLDEIRRRGGRMDPDAVAALGIKLCDALEYLHGRGLIHRDIKPSNVIFVGGTPKLADFGLISRVDEAHSIVGTEGFIPPEGRGSFQADIFSLGKLLYELSSGKDQGEFPSLPDDWSWLPLADQRKHSELNAVILKAGHPDKRSRCASVSELRSELLLFRAGKSVKRLRLLERRLGQFKKALPAVLFLLFVGAWSYVDHQRRTAAEAELRSRQVGTLISEGFSSVGEGNGLGALVPFAEALKIETPGALAETYHRIRIHSTLSQCPSLLQVLYGKGVLESVEFTPTGSALLVTERNGRSQLLSIETGEAVSAAVGPSEARMSSLHPDGRHCVVASGGGYAAIWSLDDGEELLRLDHPNFVYAARFSPDGHQVITAGDDEKVRIFAFPTGELKLELAGHADEVFDCAFSPEGTSVVSAGRDGKALLWKPNDSSVPVWTLPHSSWVYAAAFNHGGDQVATGCFDRRIRLWDVATGRLLAESPLHGDAVRSVCFSPDDRHVISGSWDASVRIWDAKLLSPVPLNAVLPHSSRVMRVAIDPSGRTIAAAGIDGSVRLWDLAGAVALPSLRVSSGEARAQNLVRPSHYAWSASRRLLAYRVRNDSNAGAAVEVWDTESGERRCQIEPPASPAAFRFNEPGRTIEVLGVDGCLRTYSSEDGTFRMEEALELPTFQNASLTEHGFLLLLRDSEVTIQPIRGRADKRLVLRHPGRVNAAFTSPNGKRVVTCGSDASITPGAACIWDARTGKQIGGALRHRDGVLSAAFSPGGNRIVTAGEDFAAILWDANTGRQLTRPLLHRNQVQEASFSDDGEWILTASADSTVRIWDATTGEPLTPSFQHRISVASAKFLAGSRFATLDRGGTLAIWEMGQIESEPAMVAELSQVLNPNTATVPVWARSPELLDQAWKWVAPAYSRYRTVSDAQKCEWHLVQALAAARGRDWQAVKFHAVHAQSIDAQCKEAGRLLGAAQAGLAVQKNP